MREKELDYQNFSDYTIRPRRSRNTASFLIVIIAFFILFAIVLGGLFLIGALHKKQEQNVLSPTQKAAVTSTPFPTSSVSAVLTPNMTGVLSPTTGLSTKDNSTNLDRAKLKVTVLNGSGVTGAAGKVSSYLEDLGYQIVRVGNADVFTYRNLTVRLKRDKSSYASLLKTDLQANPAFASVSASLSDDVSSDAEVIVGK